MSEQQTTTEKTEEQQFEEELTNLAAWEQEMHKQFVSKLKDLKTRFKVSIVKKITTLEKAKNGRKRKPKDPNAPKAPEKPVQISDELRSFLKLGPTEEISRKGVSRLITKFVKENGLKNEKNGQYFDMTKPNGGAELAKIFNVEPATEKIGHITMSKFLTHHFPPVEPKQKKVKEPKVEKVVEPVVEEPKPAAVVAEKKPRRRRVEEPVVAQ